MTTVLYIIGQPRSGTTYVADWLAKRHGMINAGEVWQTLRCLRLVDDQHFDRMGQVWNKPHLRAVKSKKILEHPFWVEVANKSANDNPYHSLVSVANLWGAGLVDSSKVDRGLQFYRQIGCSVMIIHVVRSFSTWSASIQKHQRRVGQKPMSRIRLLISYLRQNRRLVNRWSSDKYSVICQEELGQIDEVLDLSKNLIHNTKNYINAEMFGSQSYTGDFEVSKVTQSKTMADRFFYILIFGFRFWCH